MRLRLISHTLLILSIVAFSIVMADVYGGAVKTYDHQKNQTTVQQPHLQYYNPLGKVESLRFEHRIELNDTVTVTVRNLGNIPISIQDILVNDMRHLSGIEGYIFDQEGNFYFDNTIPAGGFAILKTDTIPEDLKPTDNNYNITVKTSIGDLSEIFPAGAKTYPNPSTFEPFAPYFLVSLVGGTISVFYYRRFKALK